MKIARRKLEALSATHPSYVAALNAAGTWEGDWLKLPRNALAQIVQLHRPERLPALQRARLPIGFDGSRHWAFLHLRPGHYSPPDDTAWLARFRLSLPCGECRRHWDAILKSHPPDASTPESYFAWTVVVHNEVNQLLKKALITLAQAQALWRPSRPSGG